MMKVKEDSKGLGRATTVSGVLKSWFLIRGIYSREMKVKGNWTDWG